MSGISQIFISGRSEIPKEGEGRQDGKNRSDLYLKEIGQDLQTTMIRLKNMRQAGLIEGESIYCASEKDAIEIYDKAK
jgi:hypothetical protein